MGRFTVSTTDSVVKKANRPIIGCSNEVMTDVSDVSVTIQLKKPTAVAQNTNVGCGL